MTARVAKIFDATLAYSPSSVPPKNTAFLLLDYQGLTVPRLGDAGARTVKVAQDMRKWATNNHVSVFHCIVGTEEKPNPMSRMSERWSTYETAIKQHPELGREISELEPSSGEPSFTRQPGVVSALASPGIVKALQNHDIRSLILCGLSTSGCVLSTARAATDQGFVTTIVEDACADPVPELHEMLVKHVLPATAHVAKSEEIINMWRDTA